MDIILERKRAYKFIKDSVINKVPGAEADISDTELADILGGIFGIKDALSSLKSGTADPSPLLVEAFKARVGPLIPKDTIDAYLVTPFSANS